MSHRRVLIPVLVGFAWTTSTLLSTIPCPNQDATVGPSRGIAKLVGNRLVICADAAGRPFPAEFNAKDGMTTHVVYLEKVVRPKR